MAARLHAAAGDHQGDLVARRIVTDFQDPQAADQARKDWEAQYERKSVPQVLESDVSPFSLSQPRELFRYLVDRGEFPSNSESQRKIKEGAVYVNAGDSESVNWVRLNNPTAKLRLDAGAQGNYTLWIGDLSIPQQIATFKVGRKVFQALFTK